MLFTTRTLVSGKSPARKVFRSMSGTSSASLSTELTEGCTVCAFDGESVVEDIERAPSGPLNRFS